MDTLCETCLKLPFKYKCPKCDRRSCSLLCVKQHKIVYACDGLRSKTSFVPLSEFSDNHLLSDYYFLEDVNRYVECNERNPVRQLNREPKQKYHMSQKLKAEATRRGIEFVQLPCAFEKHKANTSRVAKAKGQSRLQKIYWRIRWLFPQCDIEYVDTNICEDELLANVLNKYIHPMLGDPIAKHRLKEYVNAGLEGVKVFMKAEMTSQARYYMLDVAKSLGDNMHQRTVVEFPEFHVVLGQSVKSYVEHSPLPNSSDETGSKTPVTDEPDEIQREKQAMLPPESSSLVMLAQSYAECTDSE